MNRHIQNLSSCHQAFNARKLDEASKLAATNISLIDHGRGLTMGSRAEFVGWMQGFYDMASDLKLVDCEYIDGGDFVTARFRAVGTQDGALGPFPPTGKRFSLDVCEVWRFNASGEAVEGHNYSDGLGLAMQLGHVPGPGAS